mgnify:CR=1 FL=1
MIGRILDFSVRRRWLVLLLTLLAAGFGGYAAMKLPIDAVPDITNNQVQINTTAPSLSPVDVEKQVTYPVETALAGIKGLEYTRSLSRNGFSQVTAVFEDRLDVYFARQQVNERIEAVRDSLILAGAGVGGGSLVYANTLYEPLDAFYRDPQWAHIADWKTELAPFYDQAKRMLGVTTYPRRTPSDEVMREAAAAFQSRVVSQLPAYDIPLVRIDRDTSLVGIGQIFAHANSAGVQMDVFELLTATFALQDPEFVVVEHWAGVEKQLREHPALDNIGRIEFLRAMSLLITGRRGPARGHRGDILSIDLEGYLAHLCQAEGVEIGPGVFPLVVRAGGGTCAAAAGLSAISEMTSKCGGRFSRVTVSRLVTSSPAFSAKRRSSLARSITETWRS